MEDLHTRSQLVQGLARNSESLDPYSLLAPQPVEQDDLDHFSKHLYTCFEPFLKPFCETWWFLLEMAF